MIRLPNKMTIGDKYRPAMNITDSNEAKEYFEALVEHNLRMSDHTREEAVEIEKSNLGYFAGYYNNETRERVERLFFCKHPIFGKIKDHIPTAEEAFKAGFNIAKSTNKALELTKG